jgi:hypothetical protein
MSDEDESVAAAAAAALGEMHTDEAYSALMGALGKAEGSVKQAVLDGLKKWNKPYTPLPAPVELPEGMEAPPLPGDDLPVKPDKKTIDKLNPYGPGGTPEEPAAPKKKSTIDTSNPYGGPTGLPGVAPAAATPVSKGSIDKDNPYAGLEPSFVASGEPDTWGLEELEEKKTSAGPPREDPSRLPPPPLPVDLMDLSPSSFVTFETASAALNNGSARLVAMQLRGGYGGKHFGAGAVVPFAGGADDDNDGGFEEWAFGNLGLWMRVVGSRTLPGFTLRYGGALTVHVPSGDEVEWSYFGRDPDFLPTVGGLYASYYRHGLHYPDLEDSFKVALRPDFALAFLVGRLAFQIELGFDFVVLGKVRDPLVETRKLDLKDLIIFHAGLGASARPVDWLQLSLELTSVVQAAGSSVRTYMFDREEIGDSAGSEVFITPGITALIPAGRIGSAHVTLALRVPLGEVGSAAGPYQAGPFVILASGFRWTTP